MSNSKYVAQLGEKLILLLPESQKVEDLAKAKTFSTNHVNSSRTKSGTYKVSFHHGSIVPAYQRPSFRL